MRLYLKQGDRSSALQQYERCRIVLAEELGVAPDARTQALHIQALAERTPVHLVGSRTSLAIAGHATTQVAFVGRQREMATLNQHLQQAINTQKGRLVLVEGEAGVGKTRLVQEWLAQVYGAYVLTGRCFEAEHNVPYHSWIDMFRASTSQFNWSRLDMPDLWLAELSRLIPELHHHRPGLPEVSAPDPGLVRGRLAEAVRQWLQALGQQQPICLFLDDLQWIDRASLALLEYVLRHSTDLGLLILGTQREAETDPDWQRIQAMLTRERMCYRLVLYRLSSSDVTTIARNMGFRTTDPEAFLKRLFRETEGNPLFVVGQIGAISSSHLYQLCSALRITSGIRKPPPISTACPREVITSFPLAKAMRAKRTAEALLFTTNAASAPVSWHNKDII